jgi:glucokinase
MTAICQLVADIGGTNARFACIGGGTSTLQYIRTLPTADFVGIEEALRAYLQELPALTIDQACLALACPVDRDELQLTNNSWRFSRSALETALGFPVSVVNDFTAQACALDLLPGANFEWLGPARPQGARMRIILGPGTGLGVAGIAPDGAILPTEGGHISLAPNDHHQLALLQVLWQQFPRVSVERVLSGPGLASLYHANSRLAGRAASLDAAAITAGAAQGDELCLRTLEDFLDLLAAVAGDLALAFGALDGVYLAGGILPKLGTLIDRERFRRQFSAKGRFTQYCKALPLALVKAEHMGLLGCAGALRRGLG